LLIEGLRIDEAVYGIYHPHFDHHVYRDVTICQTNAEPFNRGHDDDSAQYGPLTVDGLTFDNIRSGGMPLIQISDDNPTGMGVSHFRNLRMVNWNDNTRERAVVNLGGGPRPTPRTETGVPIYLHDWYGAGRDALVVSTRSPEYRQKPDRFRADPPLTGDESRVAEVDDLPFPLLLDPVDDLPPTTVITHVAPQDSGAVLVRGTTADNGMVTRVLVNGREARSIRDQFAEWEILVEPFKGEPPRRIHARAEDAAGNVEPREHVEQVDVR
jgi:hypothetical protein